MAFTSTDLDNIDAAIVTAAIEGIASVTIAGQTVESRSLDELRKLRSEIASLITPLRSEDAFGLTTRTIKPVYQ